MASIIIPGQHTSQPQYAAEIDWAHPALQGDCIVWHNGSAHTRSAVYRPVPVTGFKAPTATGIETGGSGGRAVVCPFFAEMPKTAVYLGSGIMFCSASAGNAYIGMAYARAADFALGANAAGSSGRRTATITGHDANRATVTRVGSYTGADWEMYNGGKKFTPTFSGTGASYYSAGTSLTIGWDTSVGASGLTKATLLIVSTAVISPSQALSLSANPWQIFKPLTRRIYVDVPAANDGTPIDALLGTATADGYIATVSAPQAIAALLGEAAAAGYIAGVDANITITATQSVATADGYGSSINASTQVTTTLANASAAGYTALVETFGLQTINALLGTADASGYSANVDASSGITATLAIATATGETASLDVANAIAASLATATAADYAANVNAAKNFTATLATASAEGYTASVLTGTFSLAQLQEILAYIQENLVVPTPEQIAAAVLAAAQAAPITSNVKQMNGYAVQGQGTETDKWRGNV